jgi:RimJ/RimL family protein N-acetyltransferase
MKVDIPILETSRLVLRAHRLDDFDAYAAMWSDPDVTRMVTPGRPLDRPEAWQRFMWFPGHWVFMGYGFWAVEEKATGALLGEVGFVDLKRDYDERLNGVPEMGWVFARSAQGKGYATEAALACVAWGKGHFGPIRVVAAVNAQNRASIRVAEKCGFTECLRKDFNGRSAVFLDRVL